MIPVYFEKANRKCSLKHDIPSLDSNKNIYQFFGGFLLTIDGSKTFDQIKEQGWEVLSPNPRDSDPIESKLFFGRTVLVPGNRVFVISGSVSKSSTQIVSD